MRVCTPRFPLMKATKSLRAHWCFCASGLFGMQSENKVDSQDLGLEEERARTCTTPSYSHYPSVPSDEVSGQGRESPVWGLPCAGQGLLTAVTVSEGSVTMPSCSRWPIKPHSGTTRLKLQDPGRTESAMTLTSCAYQGQLPGCATWASAQASHLEEPSLL